MVITLQQLGSLRRYWQRCGCRWRWRSIRRRQSSCNGFQCFSYRRIIIALGQDMRSTHDRASRSAGSSPQKINMIGGITQILDESVFASLLSCHSDWRQNRSMGNKSIGIGSGVIVAGDNISDYTGSFILSTNEGKLALAKVHLLGCRHSIICYNALGDNITSIGYGINLPKSAASFGNSGLRVEEKQEKKSKRMGKIQRST